MHKYILIVLTGMFVTICSGQENDVSYKMLCDSLIQNNYEAHILWKAVESDHTTIAHKNVLVFFELNLTELGEDCCKKIEILRLYEDPTYDFYINLIMHMKYELEPSWIDLTTEPSEWRIHFKEKHYEKVKSLLLK